MWTHARRSRVVAIGYMQQAVHLLLPSSNSNGEVCTDVIVSTISGIYSMSRRSFKLLR